MKFLKIIYLLPAILISSIMVITMILIFVINRDHNNLEKLQNKTEMRELGLRMKSGALIFSGLFWSIFLIYSLS